MAEPTIIRPLVIYAKHKSGDICVPWRRPSLLPVFSSTTPPMLTRSLSRHADPKLVAAEILDNAMDLCKPLTPGAVRTARLCRCARTSRASVGHRCFQCSRGSAWLWRRIPGRPRIAVAALPCDVAIPAGGFSQAVCAAKSSEFVSDLMRERSNDVVKRLLTIFIASRASNAAPSNPMC